MWIKTDEGEYYNLDRCQRIQFDCDHTYFYLDNCAIGIPGDHRDAVIANIISGTKIMEVQ